MFVFGSPPSVRLANDQLSMGKNEHPQYIGSVSHGKTRKSRIIPGTRPAVEAEIPSTCEWLVGWLAGCVPPYIYSPSTSTRCDVMFQELQEETFERPTSPSLSRLSQSFVCDFSINVHAGQNNFADIVFRWRSIMAVNNQALATVTTNEQVGHCSGNNV